MFRFVRLQVQLKASEENSKKIMAAIQRSKKIEILVYADLLFFTFVMLVYQIHDVVGIHEDIGDHLLQISAFSFLIFAGVFCY